MKNLKNYTILILSYIITLFVTTFAYVFYLSKNYFTILIEASEGSSFEWNHLYKIPNNVLNLLRNVFEIK